jgi:hypothetical protein
MVARCRAALLHGVASLVLGARGASHSQAVSFHIKNLDVPESDITPDSNDAFRNPAFQKAMPHRRRVPKSLAF